MFERLQIKRHLNKTQVDQAMANFVVIVIALCTHTAPLTLTGWSVDLFLVGRGFFGAGIQVLLPSITLNAECIDANSHNSLFVSVLTFLSENL